MINDHAALYNNSNNLVDVDNDYDNESMDYCPFYHRVGACRHGDRCTKDHIKPLLSKCILFPHMYLLPPKEENMSKELAELRHFEFFYNQVYKEFIKYGEVIELIILDNLGDHLFGNVYVLYNDIESAYHALQSVNGRYFAGKILNGEFSPIQSFNNAICHAYEDSFYKNISCKHGVYCNLMHIKRLTKHIKRNIYKEQQKFYELHQYHQLKVNKKHNLSTVQDEKNLFINISDSKRRDIINEWNRIYPKKLKI